MHGEPMPQAVSYGELGHARSLDSANHGGQDANVHTARPLHKISAGSARACTLPEETSPQADDRRLLAEVARGNADAFATLYDRLSGPLYGLCLRMTGEAEKAEEILEDAFLVIWREAVTYDPARSSVFSWVVHLTRSRAIGYLRSRGARLRVLGLDPDNGAEASALSPEHPGKPVTALPSSNEVDRDERAKCVRHLLGAMPAEERVAIELVFFSDLSHHDIAIRLNQSPNTIKARLRRGLFWLRDGLRVTR